MLKYSGLSRYFSGLFAWVEDLKFLLTIRDPQNPIASLIQVGDYIMTNNNSPIILKTGYFVMLDAKMRWL